MQLISKSRSLMLGASILALGLGTAAQVMAQTTPASPPTDQPQAKADDQVVVVTARRKALQTATERKKNSDTIIDSVVADEAGRLPDTSITEVLQRVAGVTMVRFASLGSPDQFSFEGSGIQVRGLSGVTGLLNGREVFSANGGGGLNWGEVTPEMMAAVDVYKASSADLIEGGLGGAIDLRTRMPFDYKKPEIDATISDSYGDLVKKSAPSASVLLTDRWDTPLGEMGLLVDVAHTEYQSADSFMRTEPFYKEVSGTGAQAQTTYVPGGFDYGNDTFDRKRTGYYEAFQWRPNDNLTIWQTAFSSNYKTSNGGGGVFADASFANPVASNAHYDVNGVFTSGTIAAGGSTPGNPVTWTPGSANNYTPSDNTTTDFSQGFTWLVNDKLKVAGALQYVDSWAESDDYGMGIGAGVNLTTLTMNIGNNGLPTNTITDASTLLTTANTAAPNSIIWNVQKNHAHMTALNLDADYQVGDGFFKEVKVGARYADRAETDNFTGTWWSAINESWDGAQKTVAQSPAADWGVYTFPNFFGGKIAVPGNYIFSSHQTVICASCLAHDFTTYGSGEGYTANTPLSALGAPQITNTRIQTADIYGEVTFGSDTSWFGSAFTGNAGLRVVSETVASDGVYVTNTGGNFYLDAADANQSYATMGGNAAAVNAYIAGLKGAAEPLTYTGIATSTPVHGDNNYIRALPSINFNFKPSPTFYIRLALNQTISPPGYTDDKAGGSLTPASSIVNPNNSSALSQSLPGIFSGYSGSFTTELKPQISTNEDLSFEWYPSSSLTAHLDIFNKDIKDMIIYNQVAFTQSEPVIEAGATTPTTVSGQITENQDTNAKQNSNVNGLEIGGRIFFDQLPGAWSGIGVEANYTRVNSNSPDQLAFGMDGNKISNVPIVGLSKDNFNINLLYDKGPWDARLAYSWRSDYLTSTASNGTEGSYAFAGQPAQYGCAAGTICYALPLYANAFGELDGSASYKVNDNIKVSLQLTNILGAIAKTKMEILTDVFATRSWFDVDRRAELAIHLSY